MGKRKTQPSAQAAESKAENTSLASTSTAPVSQENDSEPAHNKSRSWVKLVGLTSVLALLPYVVFRVLKDFILESYFHVNDPKARHMMSTFASMFMLQVSIVIFLVMALRNSDDVLGSILGVASTKKKTTGEDKKAASPSQESKKADTPEKKVSSKQEKKK